MPDGGAVIVKGADAPEPAPGRAAVRTLARMHLEWLERRPAGPSGGDDLDPDREFGPPARERAASKATRYLLPRLARSDIAAIRRAHYERLLRAAPGMVPPPFDPPVRRGGAIHVPDRGRR